MATTLVMAEDKALKTVWIVSRDEYEPGPIAVYQSEDGADNAIAEFMSIDAQINEAYAVFNECCKAEESCTDDTRSSQAWEALELLQSKNPFYHSSGDYLKTEYEVGP